MLICRECSQMYNDYGDVVEEINGCVRCEPPGTSREAMEKMMGEEV